MRLILPVLAAFFCCSLFAQSENRFRNFHGINHPQNDVHFFEAEGYEIFIQSVENGLDEKGISKIKKKYAIKDGLLTTDSVTSLKVLSRSEQQQGITAYYTYYLIPVAEKKSTVVGFVRPKTRDIALER